MTQPCTLTSRSNVFGWCEIHQRWHTGIAQKRAVGTDKESERWREIWDNLKSGFMDSTLPEYTPHLPDYDDCPHRGKLLDKTACLCQSFSCKMHGVCSTQKRTGLTLCQECDDYPYRNVFKPGRDFTIEPQATGKHGVVIGSYGMPGVVELSIAMIRKTCGDVPILIADDCTPESMGRQRLLDMPKKWPGVSLIMNGENLGHAPGDIRAYRNGLRWAEKNGIFYICKLSQRFIFLSDNWLETVCDEMEMHGYATSSQRAVHLHMQFAIRSECVFMDVKQCTESAGMMSRLDPPGGKINASAEDWLHAGISEGRLMPVMRCRLMPVDRFGKHTSVLWHNSDSSDDYHEKENRYTQLAAEMGIDLGPEFSGAGWHVITAHRPDAGYHML